MSHAETSLSSGESVVPVVKPLLVTADDLLEMSRDGVRRELLEGELRTMSPAGFEHGRIAAIILTRLGLHVEKHGLGATFSSETGFLLTAKPDTVRAPDVAFVKAPRLGIAAGRTGYWPGAPDLAVEVISPGDSYSEVLAKANQWLEHGGQQVWLVVPRVQQVAIHRTENRIEMFSMGQTLSASDLLPGFELALADIFRPLA